MIQLIIPASVKPCAQSVALNQLADGNLAVKSTFGIVDQVDKVVRNCQTCFIVPVHACRQIASVRPEDAAACPVIVAAQFPAACGLEVIVVYIVSCLFCHNLLQRCNVGLIQERFVIVHEESIVGEGNSVNLAVDHNGIRNGFRHVVLHHSLGVAAQLSDGACFYQLRKLVIGEQEYVCCIAHVLQHLILALVLTYHLGGPGDVVLRMRCRECFLHLGHGSGVNLVLRAPYLQGDILNLAGRCAFVRRRIVRGRFFFRFCAAVSGCRTLGASGRISALSASRYGSDGHCCQ